MFQGKILRKNRHYNLRYCNKIFSAFSEIDGDLFVAQVLLVLLDGSDTSGTTLTFALYELAFHPEIQQSVRNEMRKVLSKHGGNLTYDGMQDMSYLDRVVSGEERREFKQ
jgi:cytochrome P450 family 6